MYAGLRRAIVLAVFIWTIFLLTTHAGAAQYTYDANGNRLTMVDNTGITSYRYNALNQLIRLTNPKGQVMTYAYDAAGRRSKITYFNGLTVNYTYDAVGQLSFMSQQMGNNTIASFRYTYDNVGNRTSMADQYGTNTYAYDQLSRLIQATHPQPPNPLKQVEQYMYDAVGNRIDAANVYNAANELQEDANYVYFYDKNGNTKSKTNKATGGYTQYHWSAENQLMGMDQYNSISSFKLVSTSKYIYDGYGRRVAKNANGTISKYVYDNEAILLETDKDDNTLARYTHGPGIDEPLIMDRGGQSYYYVVDGLGSVIKLVNASGGVVNAYAYDAFGNMVETTAGVPNMFTYTAREYDMELGLYYYHNRYYDPKTGRFTSEDPFNLSPIITLKQNPRYNSIGSLLYRYQLQNPILLNRYIYVVNNPIKYIDPLGLSPSFGSCYNKCLNTLLGRPLDYLFLTLKFGGPYAIGSIPIFGLPALEIGGAATGAAIFSFFGTDAAISAAIGADIGGSMGAGALLGFGYSATALAGWGGGVMAGCSISCGMNPCNY